MSAAEETKPVQLETSAVTAPVELTPPTAEASTDAPAAATTETQAIMLDQPAADATPETTAPVAAAAATTEEKKEEEPKVEPIYSGSLGYKVHHAGFDLKSMISGPKKRYFWFGEEAPITTQNLNNYLRGEKPKIAHPAAAWSNKTGKGLLYYVKQADETSHPAGVLVLADVTDVNESAGLPEFSFKLDGAKHTFETKTKPEAAGWVAALKEKIEEAKAMKSEVQESSEYKEASTSLNKPVTAGLAAAGATAAATKKEDKEASKKEEKEAKKEEKEAKKEEKEAAAADKSTIEAAAVKPEEKETKKNKSRSVSRGNKRQSIFGTILGKKDEAEEKKAEKKAEKEETKETKKEEETAIPAAAGVAGVAGVAAAATAAETTETTTEPKPEEIVADPVAVVAPASEPIEAAAAADVKPAEGTTAQPAKASKRGSIFGTFFEKVRSPAQEKKETDVVPAAPAKEEVKETEATPAPAEVDVAAAPAIAEPPATEAPVSTEETTAEDKTAPVPERKGSFFGKLKNDFQKLRSPSSERTPVVAAASETKEEAKEEPAAATTTDTVPMAEAVVPAAETTSQVDVPVAGEPKAEAVNGVEKKEESTEKRRTSFFGSVKKDKTEGGETTGQKLGGLFRNPSKLIKGNKEGKKAAAPTKVEEETKVADEAPKLEEPKTEAPLDATPKPESEQPQVIGDVVPEAVQVGQPQSAPAVSAAA